MINEDIIIRPYITEKSNAQVAEGKYTFVVAKNATKVDIRNAVEKLFNVKVLSVNTVNYEGKPKRMQAFSGYRSDWKKAIVKINLNPQPVTYLAKGGKVVTADKKYKTSIAEYGATI